MAHVAAGKAAGRAAGKSGSTLAVGAVVTVGVGAAEKHVGAKSVAVRVVVEMSCAAAGEECRRGQCLGR